MMKRWIAVVLSAILAISLVACGSKKSNDGEKVIAAMEKMSTAQSYNSTMKTEVQMQVSEIGKPANKKSSPKQDLTTENFAGSR